MTQILFINASRLGVMVTRVIRELQKDEIRKIADTVLAFRNGGFQAEAGFSASRNRKTYEHEKAGEAFRQREADSPSLLLVPHVVQDSGSL